MSDEKLLRLLALVCRQLAADDARIEIGGQPPAAEGRHLWVPIGAQRRLVASFAAPPAEPADLRARLAALAEAFSDTTQVTAPLAPVPAAEALDGEVAALCARAAASCAVIIDGSSPVIWARSHVELAAAGDLDRWHSAARALRQAERLLGGQSALITAGHAEVSNRLRQNQLEQAAEAVERMAALWDLTPDALGRWLRCGKALVALWEHLAGGGPDQVGTLRWVHQEQDGGAYARGLAGVYLLVLGFDGPLSEPRIEGVVRRATPTLTKLIAALPPRDPQPTRSLRLLRPD